MAITVHISGGLGNQMFQYAAGRALANNRETELILDTASFQNGHAVRKYLLSNYRIHANSRQYSQFEKSALNTAIQKHLMRRTPATVYGEKNNRFDKTVLTLPDNTYLLGHWQSEKYFESIADIVKAELSLQSTLSKNNDRMRRNIHETNSVAVHIRRGDYVTNPSAGEVLGALPVDYYTRALSYMRQRVSDARYYIFSDDPDWALHNIMPNQPNTELIHNQSPAYVDFELMRSCRHWIIANSSFSWWAAWLGKVKGSVAVAPQKWFRDPRYSADDLIPDHWKKL